MGGKNNDKEAMEAVGVCACPSDAHEEIKEIDSIYICKKPGGKGAVREFIDFLINGGHVCEQS